jgi:hypothetical protein
LTCVFSASRSRMQTSWRLHILFMLYPSQKHSAWHA